MFEPRLPTWPLSLGFTYIPGAHCWVKGDLRLEQISRRAFKLRRSPSDPCPVNFSTACHEPKAVALSLTAKLRDLLGGAVA